MDKAEIIKFLEGKKPFTGDTLSELVQLKEIYPWFQTLHLLILKNKFVLEKEDWKKDLDLVSAYVPDRRVIYDLLYPLEIEEPQTEESEQSVTELVTSTLPEEPVISPVVEEQVISPFVEEHDISPVVEERDISPVVEEQIEDTKFNTPTLRDNISNLLSFQLEELELVDPSEAELVPEMGIDFEKTYGGVEGIDLLVLDTTADPQESEDFQPDKKELIDKFIESEPRLVPRTENNPQVDISEDSVREHDGIFTDTLAKIYVKQGYYSKAIFAYEKLILKYPEKSDYFAGQIEAIKKLTSKH